MSETPILAIETSGLAGSVALGDMTCQRVSRSLSGDRRHTSELLPVMRDVLAEAGMRLADVGVFAFSVGPGSFTGLRVAATVARMVQFTVGCPVVAVPTLEVIAHNAPAEATPRILALLDARRGQLYAALFERNAAGDLHEVRSAGVYEPAPLLADIPSPFCIIGPGIEPHHAACAASGGRILDPATWTPHAEGVLCVARRYIAAERFCAPEEIRPCYLRPPECEEVYEQRRAEARRRRAARQSPPGP